MNACFRVRGFGRAGLLLETLHEDETSAYIEVEAWQSRMRQSADKTENRPTRVELIDLRAGGSLTNLDISATTELPWSWRK